MCHVLRAGRRVSENACIYGGSGAGVASEAKPAHLFLQRILYRINRLVLFWCAGSTALSAVRDVQFVSAGVLFAWKLLSEFVERKPITLAWWLVICGQDSLARKCKRLQEITNAERP
jgi:hypothetical protein